MLVYLIVRFTASEIYYGVVMMLDTFQGSVYINAILSAVSEYPFDWLGIPILTW